MPSQAQHDLTAYRLYSPGECTGAGSYPPVWHERLKHEVREDAGNRCVRCGHPYAKGAGEWSPCHEQCTHKGPARGNLWPGIPEGFEDRWRPIEFTERFPTAGVWRRHMRCVEAQWRILTVHHLIGKHDCRQWAMVALCQRCHLAIQGKVVMERAFFLEHSAWFKPYAAGWYAWKYLGEEISLVEARERQDELLALERLA